MVCRFCLNNDKTGTDVVLHFETPVSLVSHWGYSSTGVPTIAEPLTMFITICHIHRNVLYSSQLPHSTSTLSYFTTESFHFTNVGAADSENVLSSYDA